MKELLDYLEVGERLDHYPEQLSGGEKQRVATARALANNPKIVLADEPTANLGVDRGLAVMRLLRRLSREHGTAILVVTHDTGMIGEVDRVIRMTDGWIVEGTAGVAQQPSA
ncbi:MAG: ATP-binding cassette domain-containing protein [Deltaproteobacteria bacterium]|nr:ATP-binding cassette domain-containing protein [Deltaproteobacteria bacterium]